VCVLFDQKWHFSLAAKVVLLFDQKVQRLCLCALISQKVQVLFARPGLLVWFGEGENSAGGFTTLEFSLLAHFCASVQICAAKGFLTKKYTKMC